MICGILIGWLEFDLTLFFFWVVVHKGVGWVGLGFWFGALMIPVLSLMFCYYCNNE